MHDTQPCVPALLRLAMPAIPRSKHRQLSQRWMQYQGLQHLRAHFSCPRCALPAGSWGTLGSRWQMRRGRRGHWSTRMQPAHLPCTPLPSWSGAPSSTQVKPPYTNRLSLASGGGGAGRLSLGPFGAAAQPCGLRVCTNTRQACAAHRLQRLGSAAMSTLSCSLGRALPCLQAAQPGQEGRSRAPPAPQMPNAAAAWSAYHEVSAASWHMPARGMQQMTPLAACKAFCLDWPSHSLRFACAAPQAWPLYRPLTLQTTAAWDAARSSRWRRA